MTVPGQVVQQHTAGYLRISGRAGPTQALDVEFELAKGCWADFQSDQLANGSTATPLFQDIEFNSGAGPYGYLTVWLWVGQTGIRADSVVYDWRGTNHVQLEAFAGNTNTVLVAETSYTFRGLGAFVPQPPFAAEGGGTMVSGKTDLLGSVLSGIGGGSIVAQAEGVDGVMLGVNRLDPAYNLDVSGVARINRGPVDICGNISAVDVVGDTYVQSTGPMNVVDLRTDVMNVATLGSVATTTVSGDVFVSGDIQSSGQASSGNYTILVYCDPSNSIIPIVDLSSSSCVGSFSIDVGSVASQYKYVNVICMGGGGGGGASSQFAYGGNDRNYARGLIGGGGGGSGALKVSTLGIKGTNIITLQIGLGGRGGVLELTSNNGLIKRSGGGFADISSLNYGVNGGDTGVYATNNIVNISGGLGAESDKGGNGGLYGGGTGHYPFIGSEGDFKGFTLTESKLDYGKTQYTNLPIVSYNGDPSGNTLYELNGKYGLYGKYGTNDEYIILPGACCSGYYTNTHGRGDFSVGYNNTACWYAGFEGGSDDDDDFFVIHAPGGGGGGPYGGNCAYFTRTTTYYSGYGGATSDLTTNQYVIASTASYGCGGGGGTAPANYSYSADEGGYMFPTILNDHTASRGGDGWVLLEFYNEKPQYNPYQFGPSGRFCDIRDIIEPALKFADEKYVLSQTNLERILNIYHIDRIMRNVSPQLYLTPLKIAKNFISMSQLIPKVATVLINRFILIILLATQLSPTTSAFNIYIYDGNEYFINTARGTNNLSILNSGHIVSPMTLPEITSSNPLFASANQYSPAAYPSAFRFNNTLHSPTYTTSDINTIGDYKYIAADTPTSPRFLVATRDSIGPMGLQVGGRTAFTTGASIFPVLVESTYGQYTYKAIAREIYSNPNNTLCEIFLYLWHPNWAGYVSPGTTIRIGPNNIVSNNGTAVWINDSKLSNTLAIQFLLSTTAAGIPTLNNIINTCLTYIIQFIDNDIPELQ